MVCFYCRCEVASAGAAGAGAATAGISAAIAGMSAGCDAEYHPPNRGVSCTKRCLTAEAE